MKQALGRAVAIESKTLVEQNIPISALFRTKDSFTTDGFLIPQSLVLNLGEVKWASGRLLKGSV